MATRTPKINPLIVDEANAWFVDFNENAVDAAGRDEFNAWLRRSPEHVRAYLQISAFWEDAEILDKRPNLDIEALVARAQKEHNVYPLVPTALVSDTAAVSDTKTRTSRPAVAMAATLLLSVGAVTAWYSFFRGVYATDVGEQRSIALEDGSSLELNSRSRVRVQFTDRERAVELVEGQALFRVAKDADRPFKVQAGQTVVRAIGTAFDVYKKRTGTIVTVVEGRVAVSDASSPRSSRSSRLVSDTAAVSDTKREEAVVTNLSAGQQLMVVPSAMQKPKAADVAKATAWTEKKLVFDSTPLREVVEEFNRYNRQQLVIRDPELYDFHVSGVFPSTDSSRMIELLRQRFGVQISPSDGEVEISRAQ